MILTSASELSNVPKRIISLVPSQTELLFHLGLEASTVGITKFCIHPTKWYRNKLRVGGTKTVDMEKVKNLNPDLIIANVEENIKEQIEELAADFPVWVTDVNNLNEAVQMIADIGMLTNKIKESDQLNKQILSSFDKLNLSIHVAGNKSYKTAYLIWKDPYMTIGAGTFINDMIQKAGFQNIFADKNRYPEITINQLKDRCCQLLLLSSEPYPFKQKELDELQILLPDTKIILVDGEMFSWYGSRLLMTPGYFNTLLHKLNHS